MNTDTICDGIIGGAEFFANSLIAGYSFEDACKNFGYGVIAGVSVSSIFKVGSAAFKGATNLIKKGSTTVTPTIDGTPLTKLSTESTEEAVSEVQEKAIQKTAKRNAKKALTDPMQELQEKANNTALVYNRSKRVVERAYANSITDIIETPNGGVSFKNSPYLYQLDSGEKPVIKIKATGDRDKDFDLANKFFGLSKTPKDYTWHHLDDFNVSTGELTLELVEREIHNLIKPHSGGCAQYDAIYGPSYNKKYRGVQQ